MTTDPQRRDRPVRTTAALSLLALPALIASGCASPNNTRPTVGAGFVDADGPVVVLPAVADIPDPVALTDAGPSVTGLDRSDWARVEMVIPNDHTEHALSGVYLRSWNGVDYAGAAYPTLDTALGQESDSNDLLFEWIAWPFKLVRDDIASWQQVTESERGVNYSPRYDGYERAGG